MLFLRLQINSIDLSYPSFSKIPKIFFDIYNHLVQFKLLSPKSPISYFDYI